MAPDPSPTSLANIAVTWKEGNRERHLSGADLALLVTLAATGSQPWADPQEVGLRLRGLSHLIAHFKGELDDEIRHFIGRTLEDLAARCEWGLSGGSLANSYRVQHSHAGISRALAEYRTRHLRESHRRTDGEGAIERREHSGRAR